MENNTSYDVDTIYFDDDALFHDMVMECIMREKEEKLRYWEYGVDSPEVMTEDGYRLLMETVGEE